MKNAPRHCFDIQAGAADYQRMEFLSWAAKLWVGLLRNTFRCCKFPRFDNVDHVVSDSCPFSGVGFAVPMSMCLYICIESALMISVPSDWAKSREAAVLPTPVGPRSTMIFSLEIQSVKVYNNGSL